MKRILYLMVDFLLIKFIQWLYLECYKVKFCVMKGELRTIVEIIQQRLIDLWVCMLLRGLCRELDVKFILHGMEVNFMKPTVRRLSVCDICAWVLAFLRSRKQVQSVGFRDGET